MIPIIVIGILIVTYGIFVICNIISNKKKDNEYEIYLKELREISMKHHKSLRIPSWYSYEEYEAKRNNKKKLLLLTKTKLQ